MFEMIKFWIAIIGGIICGLYDLKTSNMLDYVGYSMISIGIVLSFAESIITKNYSIFLWTLFVGLFFFLFSFWMYKKGYWGGGDGEMLIAYGVLLPYGFGNNYLFPIEFLISVFVIGGVYSLFYSLVYVLIDKKKRTIVKKSLKKYDIYLLLSAFVSFLLGLVFYKTDYAPGFFILTILLLYKPLIDFSKVVEKKIFIKRIRTSDLKEWDVLGEDLPSIDLYAKEIKGLTKKDIQKIKRIRKYVKIKDGVRFIPVFPLALVFSLYWFPNIFPYIHFFL